MQNRISALLRSIVGSALLSCQPGGVSPQTSSPESKAGHDPWAVKPCPGPRTPLELENLNLALDQAMASGTGGVLILKSGCIVAERYADGFGPDTRFVSDSVAKSVTATLVGRALALGIFDTLDRPVCQYLKQWSCNAASPGQGSVTLRHLLTLSSGLDWRENWQTYELDDVAGMLNADDQLAYVTARPFQHPPGQHFRYSTGDGVMKSPSAIGNAASGEPIIG